MPRIDYLSSPANPLLKEIRRATARGDMVNGGLWIAEGFHLLEEALKSKLPVPFVLSSESVQVSVTRLASGQDNTRILILPDALFQSIAPTESTQGVMALVQPPEWELEDLLQHRVLLVILDRVQDPGNAGAVMRAAEAFQATGVAFMKGSVSPWNPKALRASAGSSFRLPFVDGLEPSDIEAALRDHKLDLWAAMPWTHGALEAAEADFTRPAAIVIGSEGQGISDALHSIARGVAIPTSGVESLNATTAAAILLYEARRQRGMGVSAA
jgi:TrmH family RNA methyltransferase